MFRCFLYMTLPVTLSLHNIQTRPHMTLKLPNYYSFPKYSNALRQLYSLWLDNYISFPVVQSEFIIIDLDLYDFSSPKVTAEVSLSLLIPFCPNMDFSSAFTETHKERGETRDKLVPESDFFLVITLTAFVTFYLPWSLLWND